VLPAGQLRVNGRHPCHTGTVRDNLNRADWDARLAATDGSLPAEPSGGGLDGIGAQLVRGLRVAPQPASDDPGNLIRGRMIPVAKPVQGGPLARG